MTEAELRQVLARGEDSRHQFKRDETNADSVAAELATPEVTPEVTPQVTPQVSAMARFAGCEHTRSALTAAGRTFQPALHAADEAP